ncbi:MAG: hypothetical protein LUQ47_00745 [Methanotrichaceae archaeon]|nr:hypothetical protein [Methanotrichaceae archaeon]
MRCAENRKMQIISIVFFFGLLYLYPAQAQEMADFEQSNIFFKYPASWELNESGNSSSGNLMIDESCDKIFLNWTIDPGVSPRIILDKIQETYEGSGIEVVSSRQGQIQMRKQEASTLNFTYLFQGHQAKKFFAAWNSSRSNRFFLASISGCGSSLNPQPLDTLIKSFLDTTEGLMLKFDPKSETDAWSIILGDLLSSYHYKDLRVLPPNQISIQVFHSLAQEANGYQIDSQQVIRASKPLLALARAKAVSALLQLNGYQVKLIQKGNEISLAVFNPSGMWQPVSINPADPGSSIGVLIDVPYDAVIFQDLEDQQAKEMQAINTRQIEEILVKDVESSRIMDLKSPANIDPAWLEDLEGFLESYDYNEPYQEGIFDCSNTAQIAWSLLKDNGYDARLLMSWNTHPLGEHLWVVLKYPGETDSYVAIETANTENKKLNFLGQIVDDAKYYHGIMYNSSNHYSRLHPEEGMWLP